MSKRDEISASDFKNFHTGDIDSALNQIGMSNKVLSEQETRRRLLKHARIAGCERDMLLLFAKYDKLIRNCPNEAERKDMAKLGATEMYKLLGAGGELYVDGQMVCKDI
jgi:hypothetical protein